MNKFNVIFYETENGTCPIEDFFSELDIKMRVKIVSLVGILQEKGNFLREPYSKHLHDGIFELRCIFGNNIVRVLYFFAPGNVIVLTNGFVKKTQKTPEKEIRLAIKRRTDFLERAVENETI